MNYNNSSVLTENYMQLVFYVKGRVSKYGKKER